jgi:gluconolactonase
MKEEIPLIHIIASGLLFPEGPVFDRNGNLWVVELKGGHLARVNHGELLRVKADGAPNGMTIDEHNRLWICDSGQNAIRRYEIDRMRWETIVSEVDGDRLNKPNDLAFDKNGNILFSCPGDSRSEPTGYVCAASPEKEIKKIAASMFYPNGLAFTDNGNILVIAETYKHRLWKGKWDPLNLILTDFNPWVYIGGPVGPDGMAFDEKGYLYVAVYGKKCIKVISPEGIMVKEIELPGNCPTNCAFVPGEKALVITEAEKGEILRVETEFSGAELFDGSSAWD